MSFNELAHEPLGGESSYKSVDLLNTSCPFPSQKKTWRKAKSKIALPINQIIKGNTLHELKKLPDESINMVLTSPPYWSLRDFGSDAEQIWDQGKPCKHDFEMKEYVNPNKSGSLVYATVGNTKKRLSDFKIKEGSCKKCNAWKGQLGLEPTYELYVKHLCDIFDEVKRVLREDGTCWINLGDTYGGSGGSKKAYQIKRDQAGQLTCPGNKSRAKSLCLIPFRFALEMCERGWILRNVIIWQKPNAMPNFAKDRFTVDFEYLFFFSKNRKYFFKTQYEALQSISDSRKDKGRFTYSGKWSDKSSNEMQKNSNTRIQNFNQRAFVSIDSRGRKKRTVWKIPTRPFKQAHFAVYPEGFCETPIKAGCPEFVCKKCGKAKVPIFESSKDYVKHFGNNNSENAVKSNTSRKRNLEHEKTNIGPSNLRFPASYQHKRYKTNCKCKAGFTSGIVLDPFFGAGTTGLVALKQGKKFLGIELNPDYIKIAKTRLKPYLKQAGR